VSPATVVKLIYIAQADTEETNNNKGVRTITSSIAVKGKQGAMPRT